MSAVWYIFPSATEAAAVETVRRWQAAGYQVACAVDRGAGWGCGDVCIEVDYRGYYAAIRELCLAVPEALIVVCGGDDIFPCERGPELIATEFFGRFPDGCGVMQPTGDINRRTGRAFGGTLSAAVSPWIGWGWIERAYGGEGPHWLEYWHLYGDEELQQVASAAGRFWQRPDLAQYHAHYSRGHEDRLDGARREKIVRTLGRDKQIFLKRKADGWPGANI